ncbi:MAG: amino acid deaminase [Rhodobacteraceae bacterium]|nr:amino acid deaminase [Paracoccaceae bacterium]
MDLTELRETMLDGRTKGIPGTAASFPLGKIADQGWNVLNGDMPMPLMLLRRSHLDHNAAVFRDYLRSRNLSFAPHGKTTMAPQIFAEQLRDGAWAITAATVQQAIVMQRLGVRRILIANQIMGPANVAAVSAMTEADPELEIYCFTDSVAQLSDLLTNLSATSPRQPLRVLLEVGVEGGRTGVRTETEAMVLAEAIVQSDPNLVRFAGVACFEGVVPGIAESSAPVASYADKVVRIAGNLPGSVLQGMTEFVLTGGGSAHFDMIAERFRTLSLPVTVRVVLRSGCYVTNDSGSYFAAQEAARLDPERSWSGQLKPSLEVWSMVQSLPEPDLALLTMGKRDAPYDAGLPTPAFRHRLGSGAMDIGLAGIFAMNDQHAFVRLPEGHDWQVGDMIGSGISHPCTAFDKWRFLPVVDDAYDVIDGVLTLF